MLLLSALVLGFLGSLHCLGMCGPIAFMLPLDHKHPRRKLFQMGLYHFGRLMAYALMGLAFGLVGKGLQLFGVQQKLSLGIGLFMILMAVVPVSRLAHVGFTQPLYHFIGHLKSRLGVALKKQESDTFLTIGFLNGFLPCGLVYVALFGAVGMGNALQGSLYMLFFGLGTVPLMSTVVFAGKLFGKAVRAKVKQLLPIFVALMGVLFIVRGLGLGIPYLSPKQVGQEMVASDMECHSP
ncbi:MAG: sulfite exporter TauE/SafE family protein [Bacteroidota bacterium]